MSHGKRNTVDIKVIKLDYLGGSNETGTARELSEGDGYTEVCSLGCVSVIEKLK